MGHPRRKDKIERSAPSRTSLARVPTIVSQVTARDQSCVLVDRREADGRLISALELASCGVARRFAEPGVVPSAPRIAAIELDIWRPILRLLIWPALEFRPMIHSNIAFPYRARYVGKQPGKALSHSSNRKSTVCKDDARHYAVRTVTLQRMEHKLTELGRSRGLFNVSAVRTPQALSPRLLARLSPPLSLGLQELVLVQRRFQ
jgi:hypothetical protein